LEIHRSIIREYSFEEYLVQKREEIGGESETVPHSALRDFVAHRLLDLAGYSLRSLSG